MALTNIEKQVKANQPDLIEVIPGAMPKVIRGLAQGLALPVIAGGLTRKTRSTPARRQFPARAQNS